MEVSCFWYRVALVSSLERKDKPFIPEKRNLQPETENPECV